MYIYVPSFKYCYVPYDNYMCAYVYEHFFVRVIRNT